MQKSVSLEACDIHFFNVACLRAKALDCATRQLRGILALEAVLRGLWHAAFAKRRSLMMEFGLVCYVPKHFLTQKKNVSLAGGPKLFTL